MDQFEERYQSLIELLCAAAQFGVEPRHDARYAELREWFLRHYEHVRPAILPHIDAPIDESAGARDVFESLFLPPTLHAVINSEAVILRIQKSRAALDRACEAVA